MFVYSDHGGLIEKLLIPIKKLVQVYVNLGNFSVNY